MDPSNFASKNVDVDDFMLHLDTFAALNILWDHIPLTISVHSARGRLPDSTVAGLIHAQEGIDAFSASWENESNWLFPPPKLIPRVLQYMKFTKSEGTLITPQWELSPWWSLIVRRDGTFRYEVKKFLLFTPRVTMFLPAVPGTSMFDNDIPNFNTLALKLDFIS